ncbi:RluA family pseudouridine synthase [Helicobacter sp. MIT 21-1697]|uniref:pseudouridine synthase family protein n=1 Tax=Helicobacter sp. MIT 21-1697 TaxID=2993733 RepID=UPI00224A6527|nr:RluA family pseudouridine synthase [Helicobacter sp. MIT 21-1697]MCX2717943.1 RluA family pseudouridine synthase [Helicobacter sp. MIT 21-1697]
MPFVTNSYHITQPTPAFLFLMRHRGYTQAQAQKILDKKRLKQHNRIITKNEIICGQVELSEFEACDISLEPLFFNEDFCIYDKPHNLLTHPKGRFYHYSLNDALKSRFGNSAHTIHRLDKQTSGLVLCAINPQSEQELKKLISSRQIHKTYYAIVEGKLTQEYLIDEPIALQKHKGTDLSIKSIISPYGKPSRTQLYPLAYHSPTDSTLVRAVPLTGRTHQIRLHCAHIGHRILGDPLYGVKEEYSRFYLESPLLPPHQYESYFGAPHLCLNAHTLAFAFRDKHYRFTSCYNFAFMPHFTAYF